LEAVTDQQCLCGVLQDHGIAGHQGRHHGVHRREVGIVPRRHGEHESDRLARDVALEALLGLRDDVSERAVGERNHGSRAFLETVQLVAAVAHRSTHLPGELGPDLGTHRQHGVDRPAEDFPALGKRHALPFGLRLAGGRDRRFDLGSGRGRAPHHLAAVDGRDADDVGHQYLSNPRISSQSVMRRSYSNCSHRAVWT
jgi:hypothetical protein